MLLNKFEKRTLIIKLHKDGKTIRDIAHEAHASPRDISSIIKKYQRQVERENKLKLNRKKPKSKSKKSDAFDLLLKGKTLTEIAIELNIDYEQMEKINLDFWRLQGLHELYNIFSKNKNELINLIKLNSILKYNDIKENDIIYTIKNTNRLLFLEGDLVIVKNKLNQVKNEHIYYTNENKNLRQKNLDLTKAINENENDLKTIEFTIEYNSDELENIKKLIKNYKSTDDYERIKNNIAPTVRGLINNKFHIINLIVNSVFEMIKNDNENKTILEYLAKNYKYNITSIQYLENHFIPNKKRQIVSKLLNELEIDLTDFVIEKIAD